MKKVILFASILLVIVCIVFISHYLLDPIHDPKIAFDLKKGDVFKLEEDVYLYIYNNADLSLLPKDDFIINFTIDEFKTDPRVGIINESRNCYVSEIIPKGTLIEFTDIGSRFNWNSGKSYIYKGKIISEGFESNNELSIGHLLLKYGKNRTDEYMTKRGKH